MSIVSRAARFLASGSLAVGLVGGGILGCCGLRVCRRCEVSCIAIVSQQIQEARHTTSASGRNDGSRVACAQATIKDDSSTLAFASPSRTIIIPLLLAGEHIPRARVLL